MAEESPIRNPQSAVPERVAGFTLLEVMVALFIIATAFVSLLGLHGRNIRAIARDQNLTQATLLGRRVISCIQLQVTLRGLQNPCDAPCSIDDYPEYGLQCYTIDTDLDNVRGVVAQITWDGGRGSCEMGYYVRIPTS